MGRKKGTKNKPKESSSVVEPMIANTSTSPDIMIVIKTKPAKLAVDFGNQALNDVGHKINEIIDYYGER